MIAIVNFIVLVLSSFGVLYFYVKSVEPAALEQKIGPLPINVVPFTAGLPEV